MPLHDGWMGWDDTFHAVSENEYDVERPSTTIYEQRNEVFKFATLKWVELFLIFLQQTLKRRVVMASIIV